MTGRSPGIAPTGKRVRWEFIHPFRVADGQIVERFAGRDDFGLLGQIEGTETRHAGGCQVWLCDRRRRS
jgi:hypothetical protein